MKNKIKDPKRKAVLDELSVRFLRAKIKRASANKTYDVDKAKLVEELHGKLTVETDNHIILFSNAPRDVIDIDRLRAEKPLTFKKYLKSQDCWTLSVAKK